MIKSNIEKFTHRWSYFFWVMIIGLISVSSLFFIENLYYDNYVYSRFGVIPERFGIITGLILGFGFILLSHLKFSLNTILVLAVISTVFLGTSKALGSSASNLVVWSSGRDKLEQKIIQKKFGSDLKYIKFLNRFIPENSTVVVPPYSPARRHTSDLWIMSAFLYPRRVIQYTDSPDLIEADYIIFTSEAEDNHPLAQWPDFEISNAEVYVYDWDNDTGIKVSDTGYSPDKIPVPNPWGYIKLKK